MIYAGRYINMDRSVERRRALEAQLVAFGCADRYARFRTAPPVAANGSVSGATGVAAHRGP